MGIVYYVESADKLITDFDEQLNSISPYRKDRVNSYKQAGDKRLCLAATLLLDKALAEYDLRERDMTYFLGEHGKPYFDNGVKLYFSLSHSGSYAMAAVSDSEIGCDIQQVKEINLKTAKRFFTPEEYGYIRCNNDFFRVWALKESFIKLIGKGLSMPFNSFGIEGLSDDPYVIYDNIRYEFCESSVDNYFISICKKSDD